MSRSMRVYRAPRRHKVCSFVARYFAAAAVWWTGMLRRSLLGNPKHGRSPKDWTSGQRHDDRHSTAGARRGRSTETVECWSCPPCGGGSVALWKLSLVGDCVLCQFIGRRRRRIYFHWRRGEFKTKQNVWFRSTVSMTAVDRCRIANVGGLHVKICLAKRHMIASLRYHSPVRHTLSFTVNTWETNMSKDQMVHGLIDQSINFTDERVKNNHWHRHKNKHK